MFYVGVGFTPPVLFPRPACGERARVRGPEAVRLLLFISRSAVGLQNLTLNPLLP